MNATPAWRIEKVKKTDTNGLLAQDGVAREVGAGRFFGLLGPNGAGKTTLINSVVSLARPDSGTVEVFGRDAYREFREARRMIGVSPQEINLDKRSEEHTSELQSRQYLVCRLLLAKKKHSTCF